MKNIIRLPLSGHMPLEIYLLFDKCKLWIALFLLLHYWTVDKFNYKHTTYVGWEEPNHGCNEYIHENHFCFDFVHFWLKGTMRIYKKEVKLRGNWLFVKTIES